MQGHHISHKMFPWNGPFPCLAHLWIHPSSLLLHALANANGHHTSHEMFPWNGPFPCLAHLWIHPLFILLLALAMPMPLWALLTHHDHGNKQACHHKKVALPTMQGIPHLCPKGSPLSPSRVGRGPNENALYFSHRNFYSGCFNTKW
jgi:hypothetical protein